MSTIEQLQRHPPERLTFSRDGVIMEPNPADPAEEEGVLNPAAARGPDGQLYLFPRVVARGNYSRISIARVIFNDDGEPVGTERLGIALEPTEPYEKNTITGGGCEDPRITYVEPLQLFVMTYTAFSPLGPRVALAVSDDLRTWQRWGLVRFTRHRDHDFDTFDNKDALLFPCLVQNPRTGQPAFALIHRPFVFESAGALAQELLLEPPGPVSRWWKPPKRRARARHPSMWISYCDSPRQGGNPTTFGSHHRLMSPRAWWEHLKIGGGSPPLRTPQGWLVLYHGVMGYENGSRRLRYAAGAVLLDLEQPERIRYRTLRPILRPRRPDDRFGCLDVVFPTAVDQRLDLNQPDRIDVYYGMADQRIGVATLRIPPILEITKRTNGRRRTPEDRVKPHAATEGVG